MLYSSWLVSMSFSLIAKVVVAVVVGIDIAAVVAVVVAVVDTSAVTDLEEEVRLTLGISGGDEPFWLVTPPSTNAKG